MKTAFLILPFSVREGRKARERERERERERG